VLEQPSDLQDAVEERRAMVEVELDP